MSKVTCVTPNACTVLRALLLAMLTAIFSPHSGDAEQPPPPCHPHPNAVADRAAVASRDDIDTPSDGFPDNTRLFLPPPAFNRFAVTREINDGLLAPRFAPSQQAWVLTGVRVPVDPAVPASAGRDADDR
jgi:hypothetical protein